ncbi:MSMEG_0567/Sll0786 family nitrogen starvation N-acetyltransferase [Halomicronema sp. CCY15110]|uniref:MSMEG_0567/Sll0786 family nitrogen starvation N-acetyltransferase n=1 Tax=Halomicronema sp. CCY15110 TaxID=2767773 RepID=UPI00194F60F8|nr:MSMEG_0567/Sll0786 family nitrogen starvation N-acetyltransferase [Halomicronema sp. CCY15110]
MSTKRYTFELARSPQDVRAYHQLRQAIFCEEQGLFDDHDADDIDAIAYPIIAVENDVIAGKKIVGVVRIYEETPRHWFGGRLGVHPDYRRVGRIGKGLIYKAVTTANTWGCDRFLATVQLQNVRFFRRQHWESIQELSVCDRPHHLMEADLDFYPPSNELRPVLSSGALKVS